MPDAAATPSGSPITLVFVDLVNSTALKAALPGSDITARNRAYFETILTPYRQRVEADLAAFGGRVVNTWGDDQFLIFASAANAAQWAAAVQTRQRAEPIATPLGPLQVRIGMHTGAPLSDPHDADDYIGHEVDYAKRVSALASGGQILLSETAAALVRDAQIATLSLHAHGERELKGIGRVPLFELLYGEKRPQPPEVTAPPLPLSTGAAGELPTAVLLETLVRSRIVGRDAEMAELKRRVDAALLGTGTTVFLSGEPGIGKTRLAMETALYARLRGFQVLTGRCEEAGTAPYQPFVEALREYLNSAKPAQLEEALPPPVACELVRIVPPIAAKVKEVPQVPPLPAEPGTRAAGGRQALLDAAQQFFAGIAASEAPLLLLLDDLHWADEGSLAMLHHLARQGKNQRLLIVGTYRDVELDTRHPLERTLLAMNRERLYQRLTLRRLPEAGVGEMAAALLAEASLPPAFITALYHETEGNPFFIEEVLKHLVEESAIYRDAGRWQIKPLEEFSIPQSIKVTIGRRLERLSDESREALTVAAVIGQQFRFELLLQASDLAEEGLLEMLDEWLGAHLVTEERQGREELYRFQHALIREVLYDQLSRRRKARLHERVGMALEAVSAHGFEEHLDELACHFAQARSGAAVEKGIDYCLRAGEKARSLYAHEAASEHLMAALELLDGLPSTRSAGTREAHLRARWAAVEGLAFIHNAILAQPDQARALLREYLALAEQAGCAWGVAAAHFAGQLNYGMWGIWGRGEEARKHLEACLAVCERHGLTEWLAAARTQLARELAACQQFSRAEALLRQTVEAPDGLPPAHVRLAYGVLMHLYAQQEKWAELVALFRQAVAVGAVGQGEGICAPDDTLCYCLSAMEDALDRQGKRAQFRVFCAEARELLARAGLRVALKQWYLEAAEPSEEFRTVLFEDHFEQPELAAPWRWVDPSRENTYNLSDRPGYLTIRARRGDLNPSHNLDAPRLLLEARGDFALETRVEGHWEVRENRISGLVVWKDALNFLRLSKGSLTIWQSGSIYLEARVGGNYQILGRGLLRGQRSARGYFLRFERTGERVIALCSTDGVDWFQCGRVEFPAGDPLLVGVAALHQTHACFDYVRLLGRG